MHNVKINKLNDFFHSEGKDSSSENTWGIYCGDCREIMKLMNANSINTVVTSPPYYWQRDYGVDGQIGLEPSIDEYVQNIVSVFEQVKRVLKNDGTVFLNIGDTYYSAKGEPKGKDRKSKARRMGLRAVDGPGLGVPRKSAIGIPYRVVLALQEKGWILRSSVIWVRKSTIPEPSAHDRPWRKYEFIFILAKKQKYYFDRSKLSGEEDVWYIETERNHQGKGFHYATFPSELVARCINIGCPAEGVLLDPFMGSGTSVTTALSLGRSAIGIEMNVEYCSAAASILRQDSQTPPV